MKIRQVDLTIACALFGVILGVHVEPVVAQETRAEVIRRRRPEAGPDAAAGERRRAVLDRLEDWGLITGAPRGVYPWFGSVYPGGGFAARRRSPQAVRRRRRAERVRRLFDRHVRSRRGRLALPTFASNRARRHAHRAGTSTRRTCGTSASATRRSKEDATRFGYTPTTGGARLDVDVSRYFSIGGGVELQPRRDVCRTDRAVDRERFSPANTPGLELAKFNYIKSTARAAFDWRRPLGYTGSWRTAIACSSTTSASATTISTRSSRSRRKRCS